MYLKSGQEDQAGWHLDKIKRQWKEVWEDLIDKHQDTIWKVLGQDLKKKEEDVEDEKEREKLKIPELKNKPSIRRVASFTRSCVLPSRPLK